MAWLPLGQWLALPAYLFLVWLPLGQWLAVVAYLFLVWLRLAYYAIVVGGWLWNQWADGGGPQPAAHALYAPEQLTRRYDYEQQRWAGDRACRHRLMRLIRRLIM